MPEESKIFSAAAVIDSDNGESYEPCSGFTAEVAIVLRSTLTTPSLAATNGAYHADGGSPYNPLALTTCEERECTTGANASFSAL